MNAKITLLYQVIAFGENTFLVEKKSFFVGCAFGSLLLALASFWTEKIAILALLIIIAAFIIVHLIRSEWTNHLAEEMFVSALDSKIERLKNGVDNNYSCFRLLERVFI